MRTRDPRSIVGDLVTRQFAKLEHSWLEDTEWQAVFDAVAAESPEHARRDSLRLDEEVALYERIEAALPDALQTDFHRLNEWHSQSQYLRTRAGFLVGLELGKRIRGGR